LNTQSLSLYRTMSNFQQNESDFSDDEFEKVGFCSEESFVRVDHSDSDDETSSIGSSCVQLSLGSYVTSTQTKLFSENDESETFSDLAEVDGLSDCSIVTGYLPLFTASKAPHDKHEINPEKKESDAASESSTYYFSTSTSPPLLRLHTNSLKVSSDDLIRATADLIFVPPSAAKAILIHFGWDLNKICEEYFGNEEHIWSECGIRPVCEAHRSRQNESFKALSVSLFPDRKGAGHDDARLYKLRATNSLCLDCWKERHSPLTCRQLETWIRKCSDEGDSIKWILENTKKCLNCNVRVCLNLEPGESSNEFPICEGCGEICLFDFSNECQSTSPDSLDALEWFDHCFEKFKAQKKNEEDAEVVLFAVIRKNDTGTDGTYGVGTTYEVQAANQLVECYRALKNSYIAEYFKGCDRALDGLTDHRRKLLESLANDLRTIAFSQGENCRPELILTRTAAVKRLVSSFLDELELQSRGDSEEPLCKNIPCIKEQEFLPQPDCDDGLDSFSTDDALALQHTEVHNKEEIEGGNEGISNETEPLRATTPPLTEHLGTIRGGDIIAHDRLEIAEDNAPALSQTPDAAAREDDEEDEEKFAW